MIKQYNTSTNVSVVQMVTVTWPHFRLPSTNASSWGYLQGQPHFPWTHQGRFVSLHSLPHTRWERTKLSQCFLLNEHRVPTTAKNVSSLCRPRQSPRSPEVGTAAEAEEVSLSSERHWNLRAVHNSHGDHHSYLSWLAVFPLREQKSCWEGNQVLAHPGRENLRGSRRTLCKPHFIPMSSRMPV